MWKKCIKQTSENTSLLVVKDHHVLRGSSIIILEKLGSKELYLFADFCKNILQNFTKIF